MSVKERIETPSEAWRPADYPDHPNPLYGKVVEVEMAEGTYGPYLIVFVMDENGSEWRVHCFGEVLSNRMAKLKPQIGDEIGISYLGEEDSKNYAGKKFKNWRVILEREDDKKSGVDWDAIEKAAKEEAEEEF